MKIDKIWDTFGIYIVTLLTLLVFSFLTPNILSFENIVNLLTSVSIIAISAAGMTFAITAGGFDLSVGSILALSTCIIGKSIILLKVDVTGALMIAVGAGVILGAINGLIITKLKIQTFVATLATMTVFRGLALLFTNGRDQLLFSHLDSGIKFFASGDILGLPFPIFLTFLVFLLAYLIYKLTPFGVYVRSVGSNSEAAKMSGVKVDMVIIFVFIITAVTAVISGMIQTSQLLTGNGRLADGFELDVITATILGGTALTGGRGNIWGTLCATIMLAIVKNGLNLLGLPDYYQKFAIGGILVLALTVNGLNLRLKKANI
jgi:ribose transport system permease protein